MSGEGELAVASAPSAATRDLPSLWQLRVFEAVARHESVTQAANEIARSQPAVTACLAELEQMLGVALFDRTSTGTYLGAAGIAALVRTRRILQLAEAAVAQLSSSRTVGPLALACSITRAQVRCLLAMEGCGSFRAAARRLGITEASLQRAARTMEHALGAELYRRTATGVHPSALGRTFARQFRTVAQQIQALVITLNNYEAPKERRVVIGVLMLDPSILIVNAINELSQHYPDARVVVVNETYEALLNKLLRDEVDFILGLLKQPDAVFDFIEQPLYRECYCVVARRDHPLMRQGVVTVNSLRGYRWILPPKGSPRREAYEHLFSEGTPPPATIETYSLSTIRLTLSDTDMLTVLSWTEVLSERRFGLLGTLPVELTWDSPIVGITQKREWSPNDVQRTFLNALRRNAEAIAQASRHSLAPTT